YLQDMQGLAGQNNASNYIGDLMRKLKRISIDLELVIFLIVHVKTDAGNQAETKKFYTKDDIRDSSFVKQEADSVMMIWRKRAKVQNEVGWEYTSNAILNLDKHRRTGKVGFVKLVHQNGKFTEYAENY
ncbi:MAG: DnaB-like helicase C-terminal domain-containing protein, partial [Patescibacteria group bacterium]